MTISYTEKGIGLHDAIRAAGYALREENGIWVSDNDAAVQAIIDGYNELIYLQAQQCDAVDALFAAKQAAGLVYNGTPIQIDDRSITKVEGATTTAQICLANGSGWNALFKWRMGDNSWLALSTPSAMITLGMFVSAGYSALFFAAAAIKDATRAATTVSALNAIDITQGWP